MKMFEMVFDRKSEILSTVAVVIIGSAAIWLLYYSLHDAGQEAIRTEAAKAILNGVMIVLAGLWIKTLFEESAKLREKRRKDAEEKEVKARAREEWLQSTFASLNACARNLHDAMGPKSEDITLGPAYFDDTAETNENGIIIHYNDLLVRWKTLEPNGHADDAHAAYASFIDKFKECARKETGVTAFLGAERSKVKEWQIYFATRMVSQEPTLPPSWVTSDTALPLRVEGVSSMA